jgi:hypothetical protein
MSRYCSPPYFKNYYPVVRRIFSIKFIIMTINNPSRKKGVGTTTQNIIIFYKGKLHYHFTTIKNRK